MATQRCCDVLCSRSRGHWGQISLGLGLSTKALERERLRRPLSFLPTLPPISNTMAQDLSPEKRKRQSPQRLSLLPRLSWRLRTKQLTCRYPSKVQTHSSALRQSEHAKLSAQPRPTKLFRGKISRFALCVYVISAASAARSLNNVTISEFAKAACGGAGVGVR